MPQHKPFTTKTSIEPETQNRLPTLNSGGTVRMRTNAEKTWGKKGSVISRNDRGRLYNVLNKKGNLIITNRCHLIHKKKSRKNVVPPRTDLLSNIAAPSFRTKSRRFIRKPKRYLEEC